MLIIANTIGFEEQSYATTYEYGDLTWLVDDIAHRKNWLLLLSLSVVKKMSQMWEKSTLVRGCDDETEGTLS